MNPIDPPSAIDRRVQGIVTIDSLIAPTGCVARADVTGTVSRVTTGRR